ncbi:hypothetical protein Q2941_12420 [Bradyrhizobium sp. UFLA05-153]
MAFEIDYQGIHLLCERSFCRKLGLENRDKAAAFAAESSLSMPWYMTYWAAVAERDLAQHIEHKEHRQADRPMLGYFGLHVCKMCLRDVSDFAERRQSMMLPRNRRRDPSDFREPLSKIPLVVAERCGGH